MPLYTVKAALFLVFAVLSMAPISVKADVVAWTGTDCTGDEGLDVACDGTCFAFEGRNSIETIIAGSHCVEVFEDGFCAEGVAAFLNQGGNSCLNVNTAITVNSFRCFANNTCGV